MDFLTEFWTDKYLKEYIKEGGSKIKFVTGRKGSGKSYFLNQFCQIACGLDYKTVRFSARDIWLHDFREIYLEILRQCDILHVLKGCADQLVVKMGYDHTEIPEGRTFMDYLSSQGMGDALTRREIRLQLKEMFLDNPMMDNNFALACSLLTGSLLGHPVLEPQNQELLLAWMAGDKTVKLSLLRSLGLSPARITKYNARHMLRSLGEAIHLGGHTGLVVAIDDLETLINRSALSPMRYTKMRREDTYESIRQLIDEIDSLQYIMFLFSFRRELLDDENAGIKSYQALWMRIQNEIVGQKFNCFGDIADMDRMAEQAYTPEALVAMSEQIARAKDEERMKPAAAITVEAAEDILTRSHLGSTGIPGMLFEAMFGDRLGGEDHV